MTDLVEFLKARLAEREQRIRSLVVKPEISVGDADEFVANFGDPLLDALLDPEELLRDLGGKREIVTQYEASLARLKARPNEYERGVNAALSGVCYALAATFARHPDYRKDWPS